MIIAMWLRMDATLAAVLFGLVLHASYVRAVDIAQSVNQDIKHHHTSASFQSQNRLRFPVQTATTTVDL